VKEDWLEDQAEFCLATGIAPSEYKNLTINEKAAFIKVHNRNNKRR
jgi:exonuclease I